MKQNRDLMMFPQEPLSEMFNGLLRPFTTSLESAMPHIKLDIAENGKAYEVTAEIPGARKEDIDVQVDHNLVSISARTSRESEQKDGNKLLRQERYYGAMSRQFSLASDIDESHAVAKYDNGVLHLTLPKTEQTPQRRIQIS